MNLVDWRPFIETEFDAARDESEGLRHSWSLAKRKGEVATGQSGEAAPVGDQRVKSIHRSLDSFTGFPRSAGQRRFHDAFIRASLPHIYGNVDFERHRDRIMLANDMTTVDYNCIVCTPRRFGKTTAVSMYCATLLATCPDMWISVFSTGQRASSSLLEQTAKFFRMLPNEGDVRGGNDNILKKNTEELFTKGSVPSDMRRMYSYPSTVAGLKGVGGKVLILEEASRLDEAVFKEVVLPLLAVQDTVMLAISTPMDENNFYSVMLEMKKPNGELLFNVLQITLLCDACQKEGKIECPHKNELPAWKSGERQEMIASLMANDRNLYIQENLGIVVKRDASAFEKIAVDRFADPAGFFTVALAPSPPVVYVCIDPAGGGPSCMALVACFFTGGGQLIICGSESGTVVNDTAQEQLLVGFMARLRNVTNFHGSRIVLIIERNFGGAPLASRIAGVCSRFRPICAMSQDSSAKLRRIGVVLTDELKERMRTSLNIMLRGNVVRLANDFVSSKQEDEARSEIVVQLRNFRFEDIPAAKNTFRPPKRKMTGKSAGKNDDLCIVMMMCAFWCSVHAHEGDKCVVDCEY